MKSRYRQVLADIKTAARLGHPEALEAAFALLTSLPEVASNRRLSAGFREQVVHPAGEILARRPVSQLRPLSEHPLAAVRAIGAAALGRRYLHTGDVPADILRRSAQDARPEVSEALTEALSHPEEPHIASLGELLREWLAAPAPRLRAIGIRVLPALAPFDGHQIIGWIRPLGGDDDPQVRAALAQTLIHLAEGGLAAAVLALLEDWANASPPNEWVIARALSGSWSTKHPQEVKTILEVLYAQTGKTKTLSNALRALARHGLEIRLE